jgi:hypothetical protein
MVVRTKRSIIQASSVILALALSSPVMATQAFAAGSEPAGVQRSITLHPGQDDDEGPGWTQGYIDGKACRDGDPGAYESFPDENFEGNYWAGYDEGYYEADC